MKYIAKMLQIKHGRTITERRFDSLNEAKNYLSKYQSRHQYAKKSCIARITELNCDSVIRCIEFVSNRWVTV